MINGECNNCGTCCKSMHLQIDGSWITTNKQFEKLKKKYKFYKNFKIVEQSKSKYLVFECTMLKSNGKCGNYENRFDICKKFPSKDLFFQKACLPKTCGYSIDIGYDFKKVLKKQFKKSKP